MNQTDPTAALHLTRNQLAALLAHHADVLAANLRMDGTTGLPENSAGIKRGAELLDLHAEHLTAEEECAPVSELLDSILAFPAYREAWLTNAVQQPAAASAVVSPPTDRAALRDRIAAAIWAQYSDAEPSRTGLVMANPHAVADAVLAVLPEPPSRAAVAERLWQVAEHNVIAEWICCEPLDPSHTLCTQGYAAMRMIKALLVDDPNAWKPAPLLDAVMEELRRLAAEAQQQEPVVTVHAAPDLSPAAEEALGALVDVAKQQAACDFEHPHPEHPCGTHVDEAQQQPETEAPADYQVWPLQRVLTEVRCGSEDWTWDEEWADLDRRHAETGYLAKLEQQIRENGITMPVLIGSDGRLWDGHHRLRIAVRLGIGYVPVEITQPAPVAQQPAAEVPGDTLPAWLLQRFDPRSPDWDALSDDDRAYWEHHARAVRRAVARGGFKAAPTEQQAAAADGEEIVAPHCDGFPTTCPNPITVPPAPPHHDGGIRCGCYDEEPS
ncbi:hypothetical protein [Streptomyces sp. NPDC004008]